jgi:lipoprotein-anchoring transpeptidase ErfK/SrfK
MFLRCISGLAIGLAIALASPASAAQSDGKTPLFPLLKSSSATDDAAKTDKGKKTADTKVKKKKPSETAKTTTKKSKDVATAKTKKDKDVATAKTKKDKDVAAAKSKKDKQLASATAKGKKDVKVADADKTSRMEFFLFGAKKKDPAAPKLVALKKTPPAPVEPVAEPIPAEVMPIVASGNSGELRSEANVKPQLFAGLFGGGKPSLLPETRALDGALQQRDARKKFKVKADFEPQEVDFPGYDSGTIVIDTASRYLYLVESSSTARRYAIAVGREGLEFKGTAKVGDKQEWPRWIPTKEMQERDPKKYGIYKDGMNGGPDNPLGARAIYLYQGKTDTHVRIHGTNQPQTIGTNSSNGCFRMVNEHVIDLYKRVKVGTQVIVM